MPFAAAVFYVVPLEMRHPSQMKVQGLRDGSGGSSRCARVIPQHVIPESLNWFFIYLKDTGRTSHCHTFDLFYLKLQAIANPS